MTDPNPVRFHAFKTSPDERWGSIAEIRRTTVLAEHLGFDAINLPEHLIVPAGPNTLPEFHYDKAVLAGHLGAVTERIRFFLYVLVVPYHPPIQLAKTLATLDHLTDGRLIVGTGVGWFEREFELLGVPFAERGRLTDEHLAAMIELWTSNPASFVGEHVAFTDAAFLPKCRQLPHVPLWIGGSGPAARRRVVEFGSGWAPMSGSLGAVSAEADLIRAAFSEHGRDPAELQLAYKLYIGSRGVETFHPDTGGHGGPANGVPSCRHDPDEAIAAVEALRTNGFTNISLYFDWARPADLQRDLEWFAAEVMAHFRPAIGERRMSTTQSPLTS